MVGGINGSVGYLDRLISLANRKATIRCSLLTLDQTMKPNRPHIFRAESVLQYEPWKADRDGAALVFKCIQWVLKLSFPCSVLGETKSRRKTPGKIKKSKGWRAVESRWVFIQEIHAWAWLHFRYTLWALNTFSAQALLHKV